MNEMQTGITRVRPTRKQKIVLDYIESYINEHGYAPSYREAAVALNYKSVATVASMVNGLINRGQLVKRDRSARSLDIVAPSQPQPVKISSNEVTPSQEKWLVERIEHSFQQVEGEASKLAEDSLDHLYVLVGALKVLGMEAAANSFMPRLNALKQKQAS